MNQVNVLARKELDTSFGSPMAAVFIGFFLFAAFSSFFWVETFFARNIADLRPLFSWMPLLLVFLAAALTMRQLSEEQRMGTLETLLTLPIPVIRLVCGKFFAAVAIVGLALLLTASLPLTVFFLGDLDWGPVFGGYLGTMLLAAAYCAMGLFVSSRTDNQIVALLFSVLLGGLFYLAGTETVAGGFGGNTGDLLRAIGSGSRFAGIERGILDLRDIFYYLSLTLSFLCATVLSLEAKRWNNAGSGRWFVRGRTFFLLLVIVNLLAANIWLAPLPFLRLDLTAGREFSLSPATRSLLADIKEPLLIRGYFSGKVHPLLEPLLPRVKDLIQEYAIASGGRVEVAFIDPKGDQAAEEEANRLYGIKPVPFQVASRYEAGVVNSYFHILIKYGDQYQVLSYQDIIEIQRRGPAGLDVGLRNLEYDLSRVIKKTVYGFQSMGNVFASREKALELTLIATPASLPPPLAQLPDTIARVAAALGREAGGKLLYRRLDPDAPDAGVNRQAVTARFGIQPMAAGLFADKTFFLNLFVVDKDSRDQVYLRGDMAEADIRREIEAVIRSRSSGFLKNVGIVAPGAASPAMPAEGRPAAYQIFRQVLEEGYNVQELSLDSGRIPSNIDVLLLISPRQTSEMGKFAIDQYLMRGGAVIVLAGRYVLDLTTESKTFAVRKITDGVFDLLEHYGVKVEGQMVLDEQNEALPIPVNRDIGGLMVQEIRRLSYPYFVDVRASGMDRSSPVVASLPAVTLHWASPLTLDTKKTTPLETKRLLSSSEASWLSDSEIIQPDFRHYPESGFPAGARTAPQLLSVAMRGVFPSYFADKKDPRPRPATPKAILTPGGADSMAPPPPLTRSSGEARLLVTGSSEFIHDVVIAMSRSSGSDRFLNSLEFLQNCVDWAVEDAELFSIRSRGSHARLLVPLTRKGQAIMETANYVFALLALVAVSWFRHRRRRREASFD